MQVHLIWLLHLLKRLIRSIMLLRLLQRQAAVVLAADSVEEVHQVRDFQHSQPERHLSLQIQAVMR